MDLTQEQWERLQMMVSNPYREGVEKIILRLDKEANEWWIFPYPVKNQKGEVREVLPPKGWGKEND